MAEKSKKKKATRVPKKAPVPKDHDYIHDLKSVASRSFWTRRRIFCAVFAVLILLGIWWFPLGGSTLGTRLGMQSYLQDKYDKPFVVERPQLTDYGLGVSGVWRAKAYPVKDSTLRFDISQGGGNGVYNDNYSGAIWSREETLVVKDYLATIFAELPEFEVSTRIKANVTDPIEGSIPRFSDAVKSYGDEITYTVNVRLKSAQLAEPDKEYHRRQVKIIAEYVQGKGVLSSGVRYVINLEDEDARYICDLYEQALDDETQLSKCFDKKSRGKG